jgi:hypothetical protein
MEQGFTSINKTGEELCGDRVESRYRDGYTTLVLADGMGSGVKANILSTLTSKILCTLVSNDIDMRECLETVLYSLPVCRERGVAYSTFSVIHMKDDGGGYLIEFDNPQAVLIRRGECRDLERKELEIIGKKVYKSDLNLEKNDALIVMSDGAVHAGIGCTLNFGWRRHDIMQYLTRTVRDEMSARCIACLLASACNDLYLDKPGDDTTVAVVKIRERLRVSILVGPPVDASKDDYYIEEFLKAGEKKVVCGGTSGQIVARRLKKELRTSFAFYDKEVPPIGFIDGVDLVTEGVLTLRKLLAMSEKYISESDLTPKYFTKKDGASLLANLLFEEASDIIFFVGQSINAAHQGLPIDITMKLKLVESLSENLKKMGKNVLLNYD